jgi:transcriptional regulator with XRE-family HTH domain/DNA-binding Xre family transcriptional regulator
MIHEGERLKTLMDRYPRDKKEIYEKMDFGSYMAVTRYYKKESIKRSTLERFCLALGITIEYFYSTDTKAAKAAAPPAVVKPEGTALLYLIEQRGIEKSWLASQLGVSRPTLDRYVKAAKLPGDVKDKLMAMYNLPGDFFTDPRPLDNVGFREIQGQLTAMQQSLDNIERLIRGKP